MNDVDHLITRKGSVCPCWSTDITYLVMVDFHGGVGHGAKDGDNGEFPDGHLTHRLQILVSLLNVDAVVFRGGSDQLQGGRCGGQRVKYKKQQHTRTVRTEMTSCSQDPLDRPFHHRVVIRIYTSCKTETHSLSAL